jgi:hypothetical protein
MLLAKSRHEKPENVRRYFKPSPAPRRATAVGHHSVSGSASGANSSAAGAAP